LNHSMKKVALAVALAGAFGAAQATNLYQLDVTGSVDVTAGSFGGNLLNSAITEISTPSYSGTARAAVYQTASGLDFYYQFTNNLSSSTGVERFAAYDFTSIGNSPVSVFQTGAAFGIFTAGTEMSDTADRTLSGVLAFNFVPNAQSKINPGLTSYTQIIRTNALNYVSGNFGILDGFAANAAGFMPSPVPEPESFAMLLAGLGLVGTIARRRIRGRSA